MGAGATPGGCSMCVKSRSEAQVWPRDPSTTTSALRPALDRPSGRPRPAACRSGYGTRPPAGPLRRLLGAARPSACCPQAHSRGQGVRPQCAPVERARDHRRAGGRGAVGRRPVLRLAGHPRGAGWQSAVATAPWQAPLRGGRRPAVRWAPPPVPAVEAGTGYRFLRQQPGSQAPVTWSPCRPVHYVVRPDNAPAGGEQVLQAAIAAVSRAAGLRFIARPDRIGYAAGGRRLRDRRSR